MCTAHCAVHRGTIGTHTECRGYFSHYKNLVWEFPIQIQDSHTKRSEKNLYHTRASVLAPDWTVPCMF